MNDPLFWYLLSTIGAAAGLGLVLVLTFLTAKERSQLPEACRFARLGDMIKDSEQRLRDATAAKDAMVAEVARGLLVKEEAKVRQKWLEDNRTLLLTVESERKQQLELQKELAQLLAARDKEQETCDKLKLEASKAKLDAEHLRAQLDSAKAELGRTAEALQGATRQHHEQLARRDEATKAATDAETRATAARASLEAIHGDQHRASDQLAQLTKEVSELSKSKSQLETQCAGLLARKTEIETQIAEAKKEFERFREGEEKRRKDFEQQTNEIIAQQKKHLDQMRAQIDKDIEAAKQKGLAHGIAAGTTKLGDRIAEIWSPAIPAAALPELMPDRGEGDALEALRTDLETLGLQFHPRVVSAFHTSLKIANDSPMVVLAGISGTGKSLLPKRYAESMGVHLLTVPVQPRWDSPQDLLGFFNHLQGKYVPTELLRALVQMERHGLAPGRNWPKPSEGFSSKFDQMLLVLLDEMNLARIEYYFSDFLSILENRRDIALTQDPAQRRKGEFVLDVGPGGKDGEEFRLFVDRNVLFVGTMNEDESTQSLSDKVVDRANVLRFAPPKKFAGTSAGTAQLSPRKRHLSFDTWDRWCKQSDATQFQPDQTKRIEESIGKLSEALKQVGRPFGHRVNRSIHAYVRQYPLRTDEGIAFALADQIEQRILPKLRGVDLSLDAAKRAVNAVGTVVQSLGDQRLLQAVRDGQAGQQFLWMGVDRGAASEHS
jgi:hypothetical protein